jgi:hypothetical protein
MSDPSLALQAAVVAALKADATLTGLVGQRIYDRVPAGASFPYVALGSDEVLDDGYDIDCGDGYEIFSALHVWSRAVGQVEMKRIAGACRDALHDAALTVTGFSLIDFKHRQTRYLDDPDGATRHAVVGFRALIDPSA